MYYIKGKWKSKVTVKKVIEKGVIFMCIHLYMCSNVELSTIQYIEQNEGIYIEKVKKTLKLLRVL